LKTFFFILIATFSSSFAIAQYEFNSLNLKAYQEIMSLRMESGKQLLEQSKTVNSKNGLDLYVENCHDIIRLIISEDDNLFEELIDNEDNRLDRLDEFDKESAYYNFIKAEIKMQWAVVKLKFGKQEAAAFNGIAAYNLLKKNEKKFPDFLPHRKTLGAAKVLLSALPPKLKSFISIIGLKGDLEQGFADVQSVIDSDSPFAFEAEMTKAWLQSYVLGESDKAFLAMKSTIKKNPDNLLVFVSGAIIGRHAGKAKEAYQILQKAPKGNEYYSFHFADYISSELAMQMGEYYSSISHGKEFITNYTGKNYVKSTYFRIFLCYWFLEDSRAWDYFEKAKSEGKTLVVPDQYAQKFLEQKLPNKTITRARFYSDGGELEKALGLLSKLNVEKLANERDKLEFYYRKARIFHGQHKYKEAIVQYKQTLALTGKESKFYFGANTCLQLGVIKRDIYKDNASAEYYFKEALTYDNHEYKSGIDSKAKAALSKLKKHDN
jgi:tetratricopeptide (TPR) repeat protein